jgi:hypothetical protein
MVTIQDPGWSEESKMRRSHPGLHSAWPRAARYDWAAISELRWSSTNPLFVKVTLPEK